MTRLPRMHLAALVAVALLAGACSSESPPTSAPPSSSVATAPSVPASGDVAACAEEGPFAAGTRRLTAEQTLTVPATITVADGWNGCGLMTKDWGTVGGASLIGFWDVENVYGNPCHWDGALMDPAVGPTAADLVTALAEQELTEAAAPTAAMLGGQPASYVHLTVPESLDLSDCDAVTIEEFRFFKGPGEERTGSSVWWLGAGEAPGLIGEVWVTDVEGKRVVVTAAYFSDAAQTEIDEINGIVESIGFD